MRESKPVALLKEMANIASFPRQEKELANYVKNKLLAAGLEVYEDDAAQKLGGCSGNILAYKPEAKKEENILQPFPGQVLLVAHLDRISAATSTAKINQDKYLTGSGNTNLGADNLAGISIILSLIKDATVEIPSGWGIALTVAEEIGLLGVQQIPADFLARFSQALVLDGEAPGGIIFNKEPAITVFSLLPSLELTRAEARLLLQQVKDQIQAQTKKIKLIEINSSLPAVNIKHSGLLAAIRAPQAMARNYWRTVLSKILKKGAFKITDLLTEEIFSYPGVSFNCQNRWLQKLKEALSKYNSQVKFSLSSGMSEASVLTARGLPAVNLGIGIKEAHSKEEKVEIAGLHNIIATLRELAWMSHQLN